MKVFTVLFTTTIGVCWVTRLSYIFLQPCGHKTECEFFGFWIFLLSPEQVELVEICLSFLSDRSAGPGLMLSSLWLPGDLGFIKSLSALIELKRFINSYSFESVGCPDSSAKAAELFTSCHHSCCAEREHFIRHPYHMTSKPSSGSADSIERPHWESKVFLQLISWQSSFWIQCCWLIPVGVNKMETSPLPHGPVALFCHHWQDSSRSHRATS